METKEKQPIKPIEIIIKKSDLSPSDYLLRGRAEFAQVEQAAQRMIEENLRSLEEEAIKDPSKNHMLVVVTGLPGPSRQRLEYEESGTNNMYTSLTEGFQKNPALVNKGIFVLPQSYFKVRHADPDNLTKQQIRELAEYIKRIIQNPKLQLTTKEITDLLLMKSDFESSSMDFIGGRIEISDFVISGRRVNLSPEVLKLLNQEIFEIRLSFMEKLKRRFKKVID